MKETGAHYTPPELAKFLARHVLKHLNLNREFTILDPACGDGELMEAITMQMPPESRERCKLYGMENDSTALQHAGARLGKIPRCPRLELKQVDFVQWIKDFSEPGIFSSSEWPAMFDAVIANPPYVRTQVMGGRHAQQLARHFGLTGRVDLYQAFACGMTRVLSLHGVLGLLCSNRFLSVQSGASMRQTLVEEYNLQEIFDLGDTKLFDAAVLPAVVIGIKKDHPTLQDCTFTRVYESRATRTVTFPTVLAAVDAGAKGNVRVGNSVFSIERGKLAEPENFVQPWRNSFEEQDHWLAAVHKNARLTFSALVDIHVGIKTTADSVFIRDDWDTLPCNIRPEPEVLRPLIAPDAAAAWSPLPNAKKRQVLYTHTVENGKRVPIDLKRLPCAQGYLERHREQLSSRKYVLEAGRKWYEIWVPQNPETWREPKVAFPDIASAPKFFLDESGSIVDGNCYWFTARHRDYLYLLLAIANSSCILPYYDAICGNRLYAGRRRFLTQYVERFPVPEPGGARAQCVISSAREVYKYLPDSAERRNKIAEVDELVWGMFGLSRRRTLAMESAASR